jgi:hypothetical protein
MQAAVRTLQIKAGKDGQQEPVDFPGMERTLGYIFDKPQESGPCLTSTTVFIPAVEVKILPEKEIAKMMLKKTGKAKDGN